MKKAVYGLIIFLILLAISLCLYTSSSKYMINEYVKAYISNDCEKMYSLTKSYNELTNKENYIKACSKHSQDVKDYDIDINKDYILVDNGNEVFKIKIQKNSEENIGINRYQVTEDFIDLLEDLILYVPVNSENILLNEIDIKDYKVESDNILYDKYIISYLYNIDYEIELNYSNIEYKEIINFTKDEDVVYYEFDNEPIEVLMFSLSGCPHCEELSKFYDTLLKEHDNVFTLKKYEILEKKNESLFNFYKEKLEIPSIGFPTSIIGDNYIQGYSETMEEEYLLKIFDTYRKNVD